MKNVAVFFVSLFALAPLTGCQKVQEKLRQKAEEKALETATGGDVRGSSGGITVKGKNGEVVTVGAAATIPVDWPKNVPPYPGATVSSVLTMPGTYSLVLETKDTPSQVRDFYKSKLTSMKSEMDMGNDRTRAMAFQDGKTSVNITASDENDSKTGITIIVANGT